jgi:bis(5'-nucleosyl)-tetraphosphatase (symmetrical)
VATYAIGDVQGCMSTLERLLVRLRYDRKQDRLWLAGDLVNRGPRSLDVLRWAMGEGDRVTAILGNHDLHLLLAAEGLRPRKPRDTLDEILEAKDRDDLLAWVRTRPLVHHEAPFLMVHGGLWPSWTVEETLTLAAEIAAELRAAPRAFLAALAAGAGAGLAAWDEAATGLERACRAAALMTTLRMLDKKGEPLKFNGAPSEAPKGAIAWYDAPRRKSREATVLFGHWAAHDAAVHLPEWVALDSGCVWGRSLSALRLDDGQLFQEPARDGAHED